MSDSEENNNSKVTEIESKVSTKTRLNVGGIKDWLKEKLEAKDSGSSFLKVVSHVLNLAGHKELSELNKVAARELTFILKNKEEDIIKKFKSNEEDDDVIIVDDNLPKKVKSVQAELNAFTAMKKVSEGDDKQLMMQIKTTNKKIDSLISHLATMKNNDTSVKWVELVKEKVAVVRLSSEFKLKRKIVLLEKYLTKLQEHKEKNIASNTVDKTTLVNHIDKSKDNIDELIEKIENKKQNNQTAKSSFEKMKEK